MKHIAAAALAGVLAFACGGTAQGTRAGVMYRAVVESTAASWTGRSASAKTE